MKKAPPAASLSITPRQAKGGEFRKAMPRLVLAIFISIVITKPLEVRLFDSEIKGQMSQSFVDERTRVDNKIKQEYADIPALEIEAEKLRKRLSELETERNNRTHAADGESAGFAGTGDPGFGPVWAERKAEAKRAEKELAAFQEKYQPILDARDKEIDQRKKEKDKALADAKANIDNSGGLLKKLEALSTLASDHWSVFWANLFIILLFISVEIAPILGKVLSNRGPYDDCLDAQEHLVYANQQKEISDTNDNINTSVALSRQFNAERLNTEAPLTMSVLQTLAPQEFKDAQEEIARRAIELWKIRQLNHLNRGTSLPVSQPATTPVPQFAPNTAATQPTATAPQAPAVVPAPAGAGGMPPAAPASTPPQTPPVAATSAAAGAQPTSSGVAPPASPSSVPPTSPGIGPPGNSTHVAPASGNNNNPVP